MPSQQIQWFPGHMAKTRRLISENIKNVDIVIELLDSRIPRSSKNPEIKKLCESRPTLTLLTKASLADPAVTKAFEKKYTDAGWIFLDYRNDINNLSKNNIERT